MTTHPEQPDQRSPLPTHRGRRTQAAIDAAARTVIARKGVLATTIADITTEAGRSAASFYNYYDSKEAMVGQWAVRFRDEAAERAATVVRHGLSNRERIEQATAAHWHTYRNRLAEMVGVSQLAMINDDFARHWAEICAVPVGHITETVRRAQAEGHCVDDDPELLAVAIVSMLNQFCYVQLATPRDGDGPDDEACIRTLANVFYRAIYTHEGSANMNSSAAGQHSDGGRQQ
ncbi:TetR/AcrR family transcriptional regulator [Mycolicibacter minnesotensis]